MTHISELESKDCNVVSKQSSCCSERPSLLSYEIPESCTFVGNGKPSLDVFAAFYKCYCDSIWNRMKKGGKWKKKKSSSDNLHMHWLHTHEVGGLVAHTVNFIWVYSNCPKSCFKQRPTSSWISSLGTEEKKKTTSLWTRTNNNKNIIEFNPCKQKTIDI